MLDSCSALDRHADRRSDWLALRFLPDGDPAGRPIELTFGALRAGALAASTVPQEHLGPGDRVLLLRDIDKMSADESINLFPVER
jgi:hypothetical protein